MLDDSKAKEKETFKVYKPSGKEMTVNKDMLPFLNEIGWTKEKPKKGNKK